MFQVDAAEKVVVRKQLRRGQLLAFFKALPALPCGHGSLRAHYPVSPDGKAGEKPMTAHLKLVGPRNDFQFGHPILGCGRGNT